MEASRNHPERVPGNFWFVFFAYFLAIAAWYAVSANVFICSRWSTVAEMRKRGQRQFFILSLSMSYLAVYVHFQAKSGDYKEMCLSLAAFVAAILHMLRTVLGLWQLHIFKQWVVRSICSMESLGYRMQFSGADSGRNTHRGRSSAATQEQRRDRAQFGADNIIVNDTIVGNRLSEGHVQFKLQFFTPKQKQDVFSADSSMKHVVLTVFNTMKNAVCLSRIAWASFFSRSPFYSKPDAIPFLRPQEPEELWLRWATVFISCAFPNWLLDMRKLRPDESKTQESAYTVFRDRFAEDILRTAALHCERETTETSPGTLVSFQHWRKFHKLSNGTFCKQEFLKHACATGNGLPFQAPHKHAALRIGGDLFYSYAKYRSKLEQARHSLPVDEGEKQECLGIEELEWLSVLLSVEDWSIATFEERSIHENVSKVQLPKGESTTIAIENLCNQLGFSGDVKAFSERLAGPLLNGKKTALWGNRNVLALSSHVDNWLALLVGEQVASMAQQIPGMEDGIPFRNLKAKYSENRSQEPFGMTKSIAEKSICIEKQTLMFHPSVADPRFSHLEQSLTFLGCSMENLRSSLAKWVESNPEEQSGAWQPTPGSSRDSTDAMNGGKFEFHASKYFELCLSDISSVSCWSQRYLQMRLLWELQNNLHNTLPESGVSPDQTEAILLCILSFPAIRVIASEIEQSPESAVRVQGNQNFCCIEIDEQPPTFRIEDCKLTLRASYGPQNMHIEVFFMKQENESGIVVTAQLCGNELEEDKPFAWEAWRDAFYVSLQSTPQWQAEHRIAKSSLSVRPCIGSIGEGIREIETTNPGLGPTMKVWKGWPPHRETLSKYEMMTDGLILERNKTAMVPGKAPIATGKGRKTFHIQYIPVSYEEATGQYLTYASLIAQGFLRKPAGYSVDETFRESCHGHKDLELIRYEILATKGGDDIALGKAVSMLSSGYPNREAIERAVELLEGYFTSEAAKAPSVRILESLTRPVRKENWVQKIKQHYEELMIASRFDPAVAISFAVFCSAAPSLRKEVMKEDGVITLSIAIVRTTYSGNALSTFDLTKSLERLMGTGNEELYSLACSIQLAKLERATKILRRARNDTALTKTQHLTRYITSCFGACKGVCGEDGIFLTADFKTKLKQTNASAQSRLWQLFKYSTYGVDAHASRAAHLYSEAADNGDMVSAYNLARLLENGMGGSNGVPVDKLRAMELYIRASDAGIYSALSPIAGFCVDGSIVSRDAPYAVELYTRAIEGNGSISAMYNLACLMEEGAEGVPVDLPRAVQLFSRAVKEGGNADAMARLANLLQTAPEGVSEDVPYAALLYARAVKQGGDHAVKVKLADLLKTGADGVPVNLKRAVALYESAVDEGNNTRAMRKLGQLYLKGKGVPADAVRATQLFQRAIDKDGKAIAFVCLADVLVEGATGVPKDPVRSVELYTRAIEEHGCDDAMYELASVLEFGKKGVPADSARALSLYRASSEKNHKRATRRLNLVENQMQVLEQVKHIWSK